MQLTLYTDYALRTLLYLATRPEQVSPVSQISAAYGISTHHVAKVAKMLVREGILEGRRGKDGGLRLLHAPGDICLGTLVRATEEQKLLECFDPKTSTCPLTGHCRVERAMREAREAFFSVLDGYTLADVLENAPQIVALLSPARLARGKVRAKGVLQRRGRVARL
jgi:Rrf2 family transcriptional regulator, nitric oxide-sensitive transcriptional repressor